MKSNVFSLRAELADSIVDVPVSNSLHVFIGGYEMLVKKGAKVQRGQALAVHPRPDVGLANAPVSGKVSSLDFAYLSIKAGKDGDPVEPIDLESLAPGEELNQGLHDLGISVGRIREAETLVINGLNPQPSVTIAEQLLRDEAETISLGLSLVRKAINPKRCVLAAGTGSYRLEGCTTQVVKPVYPNSLPPMVLKAVTGKEVPESTVGFSVHKLWQIGHVLRTGRAIDETVFTLNGGNYRARIGTPLVDILDFANVEIHPGDRLVLSGPMTGYSVFNVEHGIEKNVFSVNVVPKNAYPPMEDRPCINCGECVLHCPARLQPNLIARYAEYGMFERARECGLDACMECGLCSYWCPALRPMQHYIGFAKQQLHPQSGNAPTGWMH
ncbi:MAG: 4Fe-4S dicluster domain-containing protein [Desulfovibrio sp.]|jgi:electron transport complex protein RnfC|nr:4Fe-4S dicluster domain-containing protein [Desulfovibrio sp.]